MRSAREIGKGRNKLVDLSEQMGVGWMLFVTREDMNPVGHEWVQQVIPKLAELSALKENWDGKGANPVRPDCIRTVLSILLSCMKPNSPPPGICATPGGGVLIEWHEKDIDLAVKVVDPNTVEMSFDDRELHQKFDGSRKDVGWLPMIVHRITERVKKS